MRELLLAVFVSAVTADVVRIHLDELRAERLAIASVEDAGGRVSYEVAGNLPRAADRLRSRWIGGLTACRRQKVVSVDLCGVEVTPQLLRELSHLPELRELYLVGESVTDDRLTEVARMPHLRRVYLVGVRTSSRGVQRLKLALPQVTVYQ